MKLYRFGHMLYRDPFCVGEVGDGAGHSKQSVTTPSRWVKPAAGHVEHGHAGWVERAVARKRRAL